MKQALEAGNHAIDFQIGFVTLGNGRHPGLEVWLGIHNFLYLEAVETLNEEPDSTLLGFSHL